MANKVKYGIQDLYYAKATDDGNGVLTYATPVALKGAVSISLDASGDTNTFYADNIAYFTTSANNGYEGDLEVALLPDGDESFVIGGASIYRQMFPLATRLYLTLIHKKFEADTFFPEIDFSQWNELERTDIEDDAKTDFSYTYLTLEKKDI